MLLPRCTVQRDARAQIRLRCIRRTLGLDCPPQHLRHSARRRRPRRRQGQIRRESTPAQPSSSFSAADLGSIPTVRTLQTEETCVVSFSSISPRENSIAETRLSSQSNARATFRIANSVASIVKSVSTLESCELRSRARTSTRPSSGFVGSRHCSRSKRRRRKVPARGSKASLTCPNARLETERRDRPLPLY